MQKAESTNANKIISRNLVSELAKELKMSALGAATDMPIGRMLRPKAVTAPNIKNMLRHDH